MSHFVGFDCALKSLAFCVCRIDIDGLSKYDEIYANFQAIIENITVENFENSMQKIEKINAETKKYIEIIDGDVVNLAPNKDNRDVAPVERIKLISQYVHERILPITPSNAIVIVEYQMAQNEKAAIASHAIISAFALTHDVRLVSTKLKNDISLSVDGTREAFANKEINSHTAIKNQVKLNFSLVEKLFTSHLRTIRAGLREHIADSFMQILGWCKHQGSGEINFGSKKNPKKNLVCRLKSKLFQIKHVEIFFEIIINFFEGLFHVSIKFFFFFLVLIIPNVYL